MRKRNLLLRSALMLAGCMLFATGCSLDLTSINEGETTLSAELEAENLSDGTLLVHFVWNDVDSTRLSGVTVSFSSEEELIFSGKTDENGLLEAVTLPGNTTITCTVENGSEVLASGELVFKISTEYSDLTIYTVSSQEESQRIAEIPDEEGDIRAAMYLTEEGRISFANLTPYLEEYDAVETEEVLEGTITDESEDASDAEESEETAADTAEE